MKKTKMFFWAMLCIALSSCFKSGLEGDLQEVSFQHPPCVTPVMWGVHQGNWWPTARPLSPLKTGEIVVIAGYQFGQVNPDQKSITDLASLASLPMLGYGATDTVQWPTGLPVPVQVFSPAGVDSNLEACPLKLLSSLEDLKKSTEVVDLNTVSFGGGYYIYKKPNPLPVKFLTDSLLTIGVDTFTVSVAGDGLLHQTANWPNGGSKGWYNFHQKTGEFYYPQVIHTFIHKWCVKR